jgi:hypothetical protein
MGHAAKGNLKRFETYLKSRIPIPFKAVLKINDL